MSKRTPELFDLIEGYLGNRLNDTVKREFEERFKNEPDLREELEKHRQLHEAMLDQDAMHFRKKLITIENEELETENPNERQFNFNWKIAAAITVILGLSMFFIFQNTSSEKPLFETYFTAYPLEDTVRGNQKEELQLALQAYNQKDYKKAVTFLESLTKSMPEAHQLKMYLGSAYLKLGQPKKALSEFKSLTNNATYGEQAKWYMAMTYLKMQQNDKVIALLDEIIAFDGIYKGDAMNLYEKLKKQLNPDDF